MAFIPAIGCAEAVVVGDVVGKEVVNVLHFKFTSTYGQSDLQALADQVDTEVAANYLGIMTAGMQYVETRVRGLTASIDLAASQNANAGTGGGAGAQMPNNVTLCITHRSANTGRSARGRSYMFPAAEAALSAANEFSSGYASAAENFFDGVRINCAPLGWTFVVLSYQHAGVPLSAAVSYQILSSTARNRISDSQRGRLPKGH